MKRWLVFAILLPACMRGCNAPAGCNFGGCSCDPLPLAYDDPPQIPPEYKAKEAECRASAACPERGECSAIRKSSFLGADPGLECAAVTDRDCVQAKPCRTHGLCARVGHYDVGCGAASAELCRASERCATHEECLLEDFACVRRWVNCPALPGDAPAWAQPIDLVWDYDSLRAPRHLGDLDNATIACRLDGRGGAATLRIAGRCAPGPDVDGSGKFLRAGIALHSGDAIAFSTASSFAQARYTGDSPVFAGAPGESIECVIVPHEVALERSRRELAAVDRGIAEAAHEKPDPAQGRALSAGVEEGRVHAERAALWLGWQDPALAGRVAKLDAAAAAWDRAMERAAASAPPRDAGARAAPP